MPSPDCAAVPGSADEFRPAVDRRDPGGRPAPAHVAGGSRRPGRRTCGSRSRSSPRIAAEDGSTALGLAMQTHVLGSAVESGAWPARPFERLVAAVRDEGALVNAASSEEGSGSPARGGLPDTRAVVGDQSIASPARRRSRRGCPALRFALVSARLVEGTRRRGGGGAGCRRDRRGCRRQPPRGPRIARRRTPPGVRGAGDARLRLGPVASSRRRCARRACSSSPAPPGAGSARRLGAGLVRGLPRGDLSRHR